MKSIYIVSTAEFAANNKYKIGKHAGSSSKLTSRYRTALVNPIIFGIYQCENYSYAETLLLEKFAKHRILDDYGGFTEWLQVDLQSILVAIPEILDIANAIPESIIDNEGEQKQFDIDEFLDGVENIGSADEPLLAAIDVAGKIKDGSYHKVIQNMNDEYVIEKKHFRGGQMRLMKFLTKKGFYKYLLEASLPNARQFQDWFYSRLHHSFINFSKCKK